MTTYSYEHLSTKRSVRMVSLHKGSDDGNPTLSCYLVEVSLDYPDLRYQALSYVWGAPSPTSRIFVNGGQVEVTRNLEEVLRHLRMNRLYCCDRQCSCHHELDGPSPLDCHFTFPSFLWIDAICIDQRNIEERAQQVTLMREIYSRASQVIVWLGPATERTVPAFRLLFGLAELYEGGVDAAKEFISHVVRDESFNYHWIALGEFLQREWWNRVWVIQEITLAKKALVVCGPYAADWDRIMKATESFGYCLTCIDEILEATSISGQPLHFRSFMQGTGKMKIIKMLKLFMVQKRGCSALKDPSGDCFLSLLSITKNYRSTDPRDKVFAILGLLEDLGVRSRLEPDYRISVCDLYMQVAKTIHEYNQSLEFLNNVERNALTSRKSKPDLPSWAPDWTVPTNHDQLLRSGNYPSVAKWTSDSTNPRALTESFSFTRSSTANCIFNLDEKTITVEGFVVDSIVRMEQRYVDLEPAIKFDRVIRYGHRICWKPPRARDTFERHCYWLSWLGFQSSFPYTSLIMSSGDSAAKPVLEMTCFKTHKHGFLGSTDASIHDGDVVCALLGGNVPYILRPHGKSWVFVGQCLFLSLEVMNGLWMEELRKGKFVLRKFIIK